MAFYIVKDELYVFYTLELGLDSVDFVSGHRVTVKRDLWGLVWFVLPTLTVGLSSIIYY